MPPRQSTSERGRIRTRDGGGHAAAQQLEGVVGDLVGGRALGGVGAGRHHGGLQQDALQQHLEKHKEAGFGMTWPTGKEVSKFLIAQDGWPFGNQALLPSPRLYYLQTGRYVYYAAMYNKPLAHAADRGKSSTFWSAMYLNVCAHTSWATCDMCTVPCVGLPQPSATRKRDWPPPPGVDRDSARRNLGCAMSNCCKGGRHAAARRETDRERHLTSRRPHPRRVRDLLRSESP